MLTFSVNTLWMAIYSIVGPNICMYIYVCICYMGGGGLAYMHILVLNIISIKFLSKMSMWFVTYPPVIWSAQCNNNK